MTPLNSSRINVIRQSDTSPPQLANTANLEDERITSAASQALSTLAEHFPPNVIEIVGSYEGEGLNKLVQSREQAVSRQVLGELSTHLPPDLIGIVGSYESEVIFNDPRQVIEIFTQIPNIFFNLNPTFRDRPKFINRANSIKEMLSSHQGTPAENWVFIRDQMRLFFSDVSFYRTESLPGLLEDESFYKTLSPNSTEQDMESYKATMNRIKSTLQDKKESAQNIVQKVLLDFFELKVFREVRTSFCQLSLRQVKDALSRLSTPHRGVIENWFELNFVKNPLSEENQKADPTLAHVPLPDPGLPLLNPKLFVALHHLLQDRELQAPYDRIRLAHGLAKSMPPLKTLIEEEGFKKQSVTEQANAVGEWLSQEHPEWNEIRGLYLNNLGLTQLLPEFIAVCKRMPNLRILNLGNNQLSVLPESIGELTPVSELYIYDNRIVALPRTIARLEQLRKLDISFNQLEDLPGEIGELKQLEELLLSDNQLTTIPDSINDCSRLKQFILRRNRLTSLPEIKPNKLQNLEQLDFRNNQLPEQTRKALQTLLISSRRILVYLEPSS